MSKYDELEKLKKLLDDGVIDSQEFEKEKSKILNQNEDTHQSQSTQPVSNMCKVIVHKKSESYSAIMPAKVISNSGYNLGSVGNGETKDFQIEKGSVLVFNCGIMAGAGSKTEPITIESDCKIQLEWTNTGKAMLTGAFSMLSKKLSPQLVAKIVDSFEE